MFLELLSQILCGDRIKKFAIVEFILKLSITHHFDIKTFVKYHISQGKHSGCICSRVAWGAWLPPSQVTLPLHYPICNSSGSAAAQWWHAANCQWIPWLPPEETLLSTMTVPFVILPALPCPKMTQQHLTHKSLGHHQRKPCLPLPPTYLLFFQHCFGPKMMHQHLPHWSLDHHQTYIQH